MSLLSGSVEIDSPEENVRAVIVLGAMVGVFSKSNRQIQTPRTIWFSFSWEKVGNFWGMGGDKDYHLSNHDMQYSLDLKPCIRKSTDHYIEARHVKEIMLITT